MTFTQAWPTATVQKSSVPGMNVGVKGAPGHHPTEPPHPAKEGFAAPAPSSSRSSPTGTVAFTSPAQGCPPGARWAPREHAHAAPGPAPTRRGQPSALAPHPRIADVHNGGGDRVSQRVENAESAAAGLQSDAGAAGAGAGAGLAGAAAEGAVRAGPGHRPEVLAPHPPLRPHCQCAERAGLSAGWTVHWVGKYAGQSGPWTGGALSG